MNSALERAVISHCLAWNENAFFSFKKLSIQATDPQGNLQEKNKVVCTKRPKFIISRSLELKLL